MLTIGPVTPSLQSVLGREKRALTRRLGQQRLSRVMRWSTDDLVTAIERGIMQETAVRDSEDVARESDENDVVVFVGDAEVVTDIEDREPDAVGGEDEGDEEAVGGDDEGDEPDTVGGEDPEDDDE
jgi:hypothetical protein